MARMFHGSSSMTSSSLRYSVVSVSQDSQLYYVCHCDSYTAFFPEDCVQHPEHQGTLCVHVFICMQETDEDTKSHLAVNGPLRVCVGMKTNNEYCSVQDGIFWLGKALTQAILFVKGFPQ